MKRTTERTRAALVSFFNQPLAVRPGAQKGIGLATSLFIITIMALLAVLIVQLIRSNAQTTQEQVNLIRSYYAAQSGVEYGLNRAFPPDGSASQCPAVTYTGTTFTPSTILADGMNQCSMEIVCDTLIVSGATYYTLTSTGTCGDVSRTLQVRAQ